MKKSQLALTLTQRLLLLFCIFLLCYIITAVVSYLLGRVLSANIPAAMRISAVVQDVIAFIIPAVLTAVIVTRRPDELLCVARRPSIFAVLAVVIIMFVSIPAEEAVIYWNYNITLPESMAKFAAFARSMEDTAAATMRTMMADTSIMALIVNILIIGIFAGLSEEILFRGCFQRLLTTAGVNAHVAIWLVALCFSAMHFQLFGFVPRMLLGAYFGYLLLWTGSLWVPVIAHSLNNTVYVITAWYQIRTGGIDAFDDTPELWSAPVIALSAAATAAVLWLLWKRYKAL